MRYKRKLITIAIGTAFLMSFGAAPTSAHECKHCEYMMSKMDADGDGQISRTEYMRHHGKMFDKFDSNNDRFLDAGEVRDKMEKMHAKKRDADGGHGHGHGHDDNDDDHGHGHDNDDEHEHGHDDNDDDQGA